VWAMRRALDVEASAGPLASRSPPSPTSSSASASTSADAVVLPVRHRHASLCPVTQGLGPLTDYALCTSRATAAARVQPQDELRSNFILMSDQLRLLLELSHLGVFFDDVIAAHTCRGSSPQRALTLCVCLCSCMCMYVRVDLQPIVSPASSVSHLVYIVDAKEAGPTLVHGTAQVLRSGALRWGHMSDVSSLWYPPIHRLWYRRPRRAPINALSVQLNCVCCVCVCVCARAFVYDCVRVWLFGHRLDFGSLYRHRMDGLAPGLYVGVLFAQNTLNSINVLVPKAAPYAHPFHTSTHKHTHTHAHTLTHRRTHAHTDAWFLFRLLGRWCRWCACVRTQWRARTSVRGCAGSAHRRRSFRRRYGASVACTVSPTRPTHTAVGAAGGRGSQRGLVHARRPARRAETADHRPACQSPRRTRTSFCVRVCVCACVCVRASLAVCERPFVCLSDGWALGRSRRWMASARPC
jgi:hypothetical protein